VRMPERESELCKPFEHTRFCKVLLLLLDSSDATRTHATARGSAERTAQRRTPSTEDGGRGGDGQDERTARLPWLHQLACAP
jgi:hypothetical protein